MGPSGADMTQVGPILAPWTMLSVLFQCQFTQNQGFKNSTWSIHFTILMNILYLCRLNWLIQYRLSITSVTCASSSLYIGLWLPALTIITLYCEQYSKQLKNGSAIAFCKLMWWPCDMIAVACISFTVTYILSSTDIFYLNMWRYIGQ